MLFRLVLTHSWPQQAAADETGKVKCVGDGYAFSAAVKSINKETKHAVVIADQDGKEYTIPLANIKPMA